MALEVIQDTVLVGTTSVAIAGGATVTIRDADTAALVTLFQDRLGAVGETNPFNADSGGQFRVYTAVGRLQITVVDGASSRVWEDFRLGDSILNRPLLLADFHFTATIDDPAAGDITVDIKQGDGATDPDVAHPVIVGFGSQQAGLEITAAAEVKLDKTDHLGLDDLAVNTEVTIYVYAIDRNGTLQKGLSRRPDYTRATADFVNAEGTATDRDKVFCNAAITVDDLCRVVGFFKATYNTTTPDWESVTSESIVIGPPPNADAPGTTGANGAVNGGMQIAQAVAPSLSTSWQHGAVDLFDGKLTGTVGAGTLTQGTGIAVGATGFTLHFSGVTTTVSGKMHARYRLEAKDGAAYKGGRVSIACKVLHDVGSSKTVTLYARDADVEDDFSAVSPIANDGGTSVATGVATELKWENVDLSGANPERGLEIEIEIDCGVVTTKNFHVTEFKIELGGEATSFEHKLEALAFFLCRRRLHILNAEGLANFQFKVGHIISTTGARFVLETDPMRKVPTVTISAAADFKVADLGPLEPVTGDGGAQNASKGGTVFYAFNTAANLQAGEGTRLVDAGAGAARITFDARFAP